MVIEMHQSAQTDRVLPLYEYRPLTGDDIRTIRLQPAGQSSEDLTAEIAHVRLSLLPATIPQEGPSTSVIDRSLPEGWQSFRTPEGRLFYQDMTDEDSICQYDHPSPKSLPDELQSILSPSSPSHESVGRERNDFEALSYVWGDPTAENVLYLRDSESTTVTSKMLIASNLTAALRHLRPYSEPRVLWVDAICINQDDNVEKSRQVLRIRDVYRSAWRVIAWLGEASSDSDSAIDTMRYLGGQIELSKNAFQHISPNTKEKEWVNPGFKLPYSTVQWEALASLMARPWFKRLWVLQEITLANPRAVVQCGYNIISYYLFRRAIVGLHLRPGIPDFLYERIEENVAFAYGLTTIRMFDLISVAREHSCSVPHDNVYGLLGLAGPSLRNTIKPSYQASFVQAFREVFFAHCNFTGRLELLAHCYPVTDVIMPSWIPDWRSYSDDISSVPLLGALAAGMSKASFEEVRPGELNVTATMHGTVTSSFKRLDSEKGQRVGSYLRKLVKLCLTSTTYPTGEPIHQAFARLLCMDQLQERFPGNQHHDDLVQWQETLGKLFARKSSRFPDDSDLEGFVRIQWGAWEWRKFFRTEHGYLGCGPVSMLEGDEICVVLGLYCPLILRPSGNGRYKVIGGCYLHGLMDGEAVLGQLPANCTVQKQTAGTRVMTQYYNTDTEESSAEDPRLGPLHDDWERVDRELTADDPEHAEYFRNKLTGELINYDPRLSETAFEQRGVNLRTITLV